MATRKALASSTQNKLDRLAAAASASGQMTVPGRSSKHAQHVHPPRGRALLPVGTTGVPPRAKMHPRLEPATPMSAARRMANYTALTGQPGMTSRQYRRYSKKLSHALRLKAEHRLAAKMSTPAAASRDIPDVAAGHTPGFVIKWGKNALKLARRT